MSGPYTDNKEYSDHGFILPAGMVNHGLKVVSYFNLFQIGLPSHNNLYDWKVEIAMRNSCCKLGRFKLPFKIG